MNKELLQAIDAYLADQTDRITNILLTSAGVLPTQDRWNCGYIAALSDVRDFISETIKKQNSL